MKQFYEEELGHLLLKLPDTVNLGKEPQLYIAEMKLLLLLLLGCAVQCPNKEKFITNIKTLNVDTQLAIVECIKQVCFCKFLISIIQLFLFFYFFVLNIYLLGYRSSRYSYHSRCNGKCKYGIFICRNKKYVPRIRFISSGNYINTIMCYISKIQNILFIDLTEMERYYYK